MTESWLVFDDLDPHGRVTIKRVDLAYNAAQARAGLGFVIRVNAALHDPDPSGLPSEQDEAALAAAEDRLVDKLGRAAGAVLVGVITGDGQRDWYFYTAADSVSLETMQRAINRLADFKVKCYHRPDPLWEKYDQRLHPTPAQIRRGRDAQVVSSLMQQGDALDRPRPIDHWAYFNGPDQRRAFAEALQPLGFAVKQWIEPDAEHPQHGLLFQRDDAADLDAINAVTTLLDGLAATHHGEYDGWESPVVQPEE